MSRIRSPIRNWSFNLGIRGDLYDGFSATARQAEPRVGIAYNLNQPIPFSKFPTPEPWKLHSMRTWSLPALGVTSHF